MLLRKEQIRWISDLIYGYRLKMLFFFVLELLAIALSMSFIFYSKKAVDIALNADFGDLKAVLGFVIGCSLVGVVCKLVSQRISQVLVINLTLKLQNSLLYKHMISVWSVIKKWHTGDLLVRINSDSTEVVQMLAVTWMGTILTVLKLIASFVFLYSMDPMLAFVIVGISPIFVFSKIYFKKMRKLSADTKGAESTLGGVMQENLRFRILVRSLGIVEERQDRMLLAQEKFKNLKMRSLNFSLFTQTVLKFAVNIGYLTVFVWGIYRLNKGEITFGTMTAFLQLVVHIQSPMLALMSIFPAFIRFGVSLDRLIEMDSVEQEPLKDQIRLDTVESIRFDNVSFGYDDTEVLKNLSVKINKGEKVALIGSSGKGKTTFIRLLLALLKPDEGRVLLEAAEGKSFDISTAYNNNFCYVPQGNTLFSGTIRENLLISSVVGISEDEIRNVLYCACAEFVWDLPLGLDTVIGESGMGLSEGQAQRIAIARALLKDAAVLLFDEATSALDENTTNLFIERLFSLTFNKIVIFVTHDMKLAHSCDQTILIS